ncbi:hypothetical protein KIN20_017733 [Parelaphostrongylus tenuis]|uniref:Uncharacterized protein n=1 Tax=Parelaphostrongylus tenuis TaxID=148309 RepID=A0AAD5QNU2_PARTN|nr:hypothetical protein KIN20_017733 [Parelaphostrongylus tenuis]
MTNGNQKEENHETLIKKLMDILLCRSSFEYRFEITISSKMSRSLKGIVNND